MSDEYRNQGMANSLVDDSLNPQSLPPNARDAITNNYSPPGDSTSSGGYGSSMNPHSASVQRGQSANTALNSQDFRPAATNSNVSPSPAPALQQSTAGGADLRSEMQDAKQGTDVESRREMASELRSGLNPYAGSSIETREEAENKLSEQ